MGSGSAIGRTAGSIAGGAGGAALGSAVLPGVGTYVGGALGSIGGGLVGGAVGGLFDHPDVPGTRVSSAESPWRRGAAALPGAAQPGLIASQAQTPGAPPMPAGYTAPTYGGINAANFQVPNYDTNQGKFASAAQAAAARSAPQMNTAYSDEGRMGQSGLASALQAQAAGQGTSAAQLQMQQGFQQQIAAQQAQAASARGGVNPALLQRQLADQQAEGLQGMNAQGGILRAQESNMAQQQLGNVLGAQRTADIGIASSNQNATLAGQAQNDALVQMYTRAGMDMDTAKLQAAIEMSRQEQGGKLAYDQLGLQGATLNHNTALGFGNLGLGYTKAANDLSLGNNSEAGTNSRFNTGQNTTLAAAGIGAAGSAAAYWATHRGQAPGAPPAPTTPDGGYVDPYANGSNTLNGADNGGAGGYVDPYANGSSTLDNPYAGG